MTFHKHFSTLKSAVLAAFAFVCGSAAATDYYWIGGESGAWDDGANWSLTEGGEAAGDYPRTSGGSDHAYFSSDVEVSLLSSTYCRKLTINGNVTFKNGRIQTASNNNTSPLTIDGSGLMRLSGAEIVAPYSTSASGGASAISCSVEIVADTTNVISLATGSSRYSSVTVSGALSGSGSLIVRGGAAGSDNYIAYFSGDASAFSGSFADCREGDAVHARIRFMNVAALSPKATYTLETYQSGGSNYPLRAGGTGMTYQIGALNGLVYFDGNNNSKTGQYYGYVLEIGGKNEDCSFGGTLARNGYASTTKKVGTGKMTFTGSQIPVLELVDGIYEVGSDGAVPGTKMTFSGGAFSVVPGITADPMPKFDPASTAAVIFDDCGNDTVLTGSLTAERVPNGFIKRGSGTLTLTTAPTHTSQTIVEDGILLLPPGTVVESLDVKTGAAVGLYTTSAITDPTEVMTIKSLAEGVDLSVAFPNTQTTSFTFETNEETGAITVLATRAPAVFVWTGAQDAAWENVANWTVAGETATTEPLPVDTVVFPAAESPWLVEMNGEHIVAEASFVGTTKLVGASLRPAAISGEGQIVLGDGARIATYQGSLAIANPIEIVAAPETPAELYWSDSSQNIELTGTITGLGTVKGYNSGRANYSGIKISGDMTEFCGTFLAPKNTIDRNMSEVKSMASVSEKAIYDVSIGSGTFLNLSAHSTVSFGMLTGFISHQDQTSSIGLTVEIDKLGLDGTLGGSAFSTAYPHLAGARGHVIKKVGAGKVDMSLRLAKEIDINAGILEIMSNQVVKTMYKQNGSSYQLTTDPDEAVGTHETDLVFGGGTLKLNEAVTVDPSANIKPSAANIVIDLEDDRTFATALPEMAGGLIKKGTGTLTLAATPAYAGVTTVESGELVVPAESRIHWDVLSAGKLTGGTKASYDYQVATTNVYDCAAAVPSAGNHTLNLDNLLAIDLTSVTSVEKSSKFVIAEAKSFNLNGRAITKAGRENITLIWGEDTVFPKGKTAADFTLQVVSGQLVVANKAVGIAVIIK